MLAPYRATLVELLRTALPTLDVYGSIPDDVNVVPCIVVGQPSATPSVDGATWDRDLTVYVIGRRPDVADGEAELTQLADQVWLVLGGTRGTRDGDTRISVEQLRPQTVQVAAIDHDAYLLTVSSPMTTC